MENLKVIDNKEKERFEIDLDGKIALIDYSEQNGVVAMTHTEVPPEFEGKGIGSKLVKGALEIVRNDGKRVRPLCTFVAAYIKRHPEYESLVV
ncbi:MAG TPA: GNAT family N-acetyltransferase [Pyrinomonadaceae bacterium]|nr:GNAT family N-acetyltransferase [Pyrinomonadaceae bacterium]